MEKTDRKTDKTDIWPARRSIFQRSVYLEPRNEASRVFHYCIFVGFLEASPTSRKPSYSPAADKCECAN